jgi:hypothetical protein
MLRLMSSVSDAPWRIANRQDLKEAFGPVWKAQMEKWGRG